MENQLPYRSTIKSKPFFYKETKKLSGLVLQELNELEIKHQVIDENILQVKTETRKREMASTILKRLKSIDEVLIEKIITGDVSTSKLIVLYSILKTDRLFYEFMNEVFSEKLIYHNLSLADRDFNVFFESKKQQSNTVRNWKEYTFYKLQQVYIRILFEAGLLKKQQGDREIIVPIINPELIEHIKNTDDPRFIQAILGGDY